MKIILSTDIDESLMWQKSELANKKQRVSSETFDSRKKKDNLNNRNRIENNPLDEVKSYVEEHSNGSRVFYGQTTDVFKRYEGVFGNYGIRGKRVIRKLQLR